MPIASIEVVTAEDGGLPDGVAQTLADAIGRALDSPPGETWVRLRSLASDRYAENETRTTVGSLPVFVTILERLAPQGAKLDAEVAALTRAVAEAVGRPGICVHIEFAPSAAGRMSFGGTPVR